ncbi:hypothetical protein B0H13DRAFT_1912400 [Mycena leptocephala]|nr:hypothetical protein B0H13DRAFT_1912400 [Mycena leptocephala]
MTVSTGSSVPSDSVIREHGGGGSRAGVRGLGLAMAITRKGGEVETEGEKTTMNGTGTGTGEEGDILEVGTGTGSFVGFSGYCNLPPPNRTGPSTGSDPTLEKYSNLYIRSSESGCSCEMVGESDLDYRTRSGIFEFEWDDLILDPLDGEPAYHLAYVIADSLRQRICGSDNPTAAVGPELKVYINQGQMKLGIHPRLRTAHRKEMTVEKMHNENFQEYPTQQGLRFPSREWIPLNSGTAQME